MKLLITGITGLIGRHIRKICEVRDYEVNYLTTNRDKIEDLLGYKGFYWDPENGEIDKACLDGVDKIIHLAGVSVFSRWTRGHRKKILSSRIKSAALLYTLLSENEHKVKHLISASAIGIYPDSISHLYNEESEEKASGFLGMVVKEWEKSADAFEDLGIRVAKIRIGLVLASEAGYLAEFKKTIKNYIGSNLGSGKQWQSWIHVEDVARLFIFVAEEELAGIFNGVAPNPVKQKNLVKCIAKHLDKPLFLPSIPAPIIRLAMGNMGSMVLSSQLVQSKYLENSGFIFKYTQMENAIVDLL